MKNIISFSLFESHATLKPGASVEFKVVEIDDKLVVIKDDKDGELVTIRRSDLGPMYEN